MELTALPGVGPRTREQLGRLGLVTVEDLLLHVPSRYEDRTRVTPVAAVVPGVAARFLVQVRDARVQFGARRSLRIDAADASGELTIRLFHFRQSTGFAEGQWLLCWGVLRESRWGRECVHPQMQRVASPQALPDLGDRLTPVYPTTAGLPQSRWQTLQERAIAHVEPLFPELMPEPLAPALVLADALRCVHFPPVDQPATLQAARDRLAFEELLAQRLAVLRGRSVAARRPAPACPVAPEVAAALDAGLPFALTAAQQRVIAEIAQDLDCGEPMLRLVQGDVGCGKTVVAAHAVVQALAAGGQVAIMAPTEILARQHAQSLRAWLEPLGFTVGLLVGGQKTAERRRQVQDIASGALRLVVGTQALFQQGVEFAQLHLVIVDEQHRFGVGQRLALRDKSGPVQAHQLILTATPIPRTLAQTLYADLAISRIDALPPGRQPVQTVAMAQSRRPDVVERLRVVCAAGAQAFWVCPALSESEHATAAEDIAEMLRESLPELPIGLIHGQMKTDDKVAVMAQFHAGAMAILVATTVIEVGVDVPNATIIIIDEAERLGLAQLHQLRGRVGRGAAPSFCVLLYKPPLADTAQARLQALCTTHDGFALAETDLQLRGPGELLGTAQSGEQRLRFADALLDTRLLPQVISVADAMAATEPQRATALVRRWLGARAHYADV